MKYLLLVLAAERLETIREIMLTTAGESEPRLEPRSGADSMPASLDALRIDRSSNDRSGVARTLWLVLVAAAVGGGGAAGWHWWEEAQIPVVRAVPVRQSLLANGQPTILNASGYVTARLRSTVSSEVTGRIVEVLVEEGMAVTEGQILARLDDTAERAYLALAEAQLGAARGWRCATWRPGSISAGSVSCSSRA